MTRKLPSLNALRSFEAAGRRASFTRAAAELNVTHGAVSRQVAALEAYLGTALFHRTASILSLTETGRAYLPEVTAALDRLALASMQAAAKADPLALRVNAPPTFAMRWLIPRLSTFQRRRPDVEVRLSTSIAPVDFERQACDLAIRGAESPLAHCVSQPFMTEFIVPVCHVDLLEGSKLADPANLRNHHLLDYATEPYGWRRWLATVGQSGLKPAGTLHFEQMYFALQAALEGLGLVLVPLFLVIDDIAAGRLCVPFGPRGAKSRRYYAHIRQRSPATDSFFVWMVQEGRETERMMAQWARASGWPPESLAVWCDGDS